MARSVDTAWLVARASNTIGVVEDDAAVRRIFLRTLQAADELEVVFAAGSLAEARSAIKEGLPALCIVDIGLPDGSGIDLIREIRELGEVRILVATVLGDRKTVLNALRAGADGYLLKTLSASDFLANVRQTLAGFTPISPQVASYLLEIMRLGSSTAPTSSPDCRLTAREAELLSIFGRGLSYDETARVLGITANTVRDFVKKIYSKLQVHNRAEALFEARSLGLIDREPD